MFSKILIPFFALLFSHNSILAYSHYFKIPNSESNINLITDTTKDHMIFWGRPPREPIELFGSAWWIYASGPIDNDAAARLNEFIEKNKIPAKSYLVMDSPGGSLLGGITLGRAIREAGLYTYIGKISDNPKELMKQGSCYSAGAIAFLGGKFRWIKDGSVFGVHRFKFTYMATENADVAQILSASIMQYLTDMGIDEGLFNEMSSAGSDSISILNKSKLAKFKVINDGYSSTHWSLQSANEKIYLKGERETWRGVNKLLFYCENNQMVLHAIFDPEGHEDEILQTMNYHSIYIDGEYIPLSQQILLSKKSIKGWINISFKIDQIIIRKLIEAKEVGIICQYYKGHGMFLGFQDMDFSEGSEKLIALIKTCAY